MEKAFKAFNHGTGKIDLSNHKGLSVMRPVEIHHKEDGSITNEPSFAIVMVAPYEYPIVGEISLKMLNDGLNKIGYEIVKKPTFGEVCQCTNRASFYRDKEGNDICYDCDLPLPF